MTAGDEPAMTDTVTDTVAATVERRRRLRRPARARRRRTTPLPRPARRTARSGRFLRRSDRAVGLRRRILLIFTLGSLTLSAFLAVTTYGLVRSNLDRAALLASRRPPTPTPRSPSASSVPSRRDHSGRSTSSTSSACSGRSIHYHDEWSAGISRFGPESIPADAAGLGSSSTRSRRG